jgi:uncharacterized protein (DUF433 family)
VSTAPVAESYPHIERDTRGVPIVAGTTMKIIELVMAQRAHGWSPEELSFQFHYLSMAQIHAALAYYWDHREELDADMDQRAARAANLEAAERTTPLAQRLAALKHRG